MKALLRTRCGCSREIDVTRPPPTAIEIPLREHTPATWIAEPRFATALNIPIRRFEHNRLGSTANCADYLEVG